MKEILKRCFDNNTLVTIITNLNKIDSVIVGRIYQLDDESVEVDEINFNGRITRKRKLKLKSVRILRYGDIYSNEIKELIKFHKTSKEDKVSPKTKYTSNKSTPQFLMLLAELQRSQEMVSIFVKDDFRFGIINELSESHVKIKSITYGGWDDGFAVIPIKRIMDIGRNGSDEQQVSYLYRIRKGISGNLANVSI